MMFLLDQCNLALFPNSRKKEKKKAALILQMNDDSVLLKPKMFMIGYTLLPTFEATTQ